MSFTIPLLLAMIHKAWTEETPSLTNRTNSLFKNANISSMYLSFPNSETLKKFEHKFPSNRKNRLFCYLHILVSNVDLNPVCLKIENIKADNILLLSLVYPMETMTSFLVSLSEKEKEKLILKDAKSISDKIMEERKELIKVLIKRKESPVKHHKSPIKGSVKIGLSDNKLYVVCVKIHNGFEEVEVPFVFSEFEEAVLEEKLGAKAEEVTKLNSRESFTLLKKFDKKFVLEKYNEVMKLKNNENKNLNNLEEVEEGNEDAMANDEGNAEDLSNRSEGSDEKDDEEIVSIWHLIWLLIFSVVVAGIVGFIVTLFTKYRKEKFYSIMSQ